MKRINKDKFFRVRPPEYMHATSSSSSVVSDSLSINSESSPASPSNAHPSLSTNDSIDTGTAHISGSSTSLQAGGLNAKPDTLYTSNHCDIDSFHTVLFHSPRHRESGTSSSSEHIDTSLKGNTTSSLEDSGNGTEDDTAYHGLAHLGRLLSLVFRLPPSVVRHRLLKSSLLSRTIPL